MDTTELETHAPALPTDVTSFVGRRADRQQVRALLSDARTVTLTGIGGVGKTRLALHVATTLRRVYKDGVAFVDLAPHRDPEQVTFAIGTALGLQGRSNRATITALVDYLADRSCLIVLDNCEHLIDKVAVVADTLMRTCPDLRILATSREPLRIPGEAVHPVPPLSTPTPGTTDPLQQYDAVTLLLDRARASVPDFELNATNREAIATIATRLEGIPLAIELAAARLRSMSPDEIARNLTERWDLLSRGSRNAPDRQRTMASCIEWSFDLCSPAEQQAWAHLSIFAGGFEYDAAQAVCGTLDEPLADVIADLVDKSVVIASHTGPITRYRLLPPIRHRGLTRLREADQLTLLRHRHKDWCVSLASEAAEMWFGPRQVEAIARIRREFGNIGSCLEFCWSEPGEADAGLAMGADLLEFGMANGIFRQGRMWFDRLLALGSDTPDLRARALRTASWWAAMQGDLDAAAELVAEGRGLAESVGGHTEVLVTQAEAFVTMFSGDSDEAARLFETAVDGFRAFEDSGQLAHTHAVAALNHCFRLDLEAALDATKACISLTEPAGESWYRSYALWIAGLAHWVAGHAGEARGLQLESLRLRRAVQDPLGIGTSVEAVAWMIAGDEPRRAARLLGGARAIWDRIETSTAALPGLHEFHRQCVDALRMDLGEDAYAAAFEEGRVAPPSELIAEILDDRPAEAGPAGNRRARRTEKAKPLLTPREREIAGLVASGMSNKEIAAELVISKRTAETHVDHILTKLGFHNRNQIAAWVTEQATANEGSAPQP